MSVIKGIPVANTKNIYILMEIPSITDITMDYGENL